jgi:hypothetical protein
MAKWLGARLAAHAERRWVSLALNPSYELVRAGYSAASVRRRRPSTGRRYCPV